MNSTKAIEESVCKIHGHNIIGIGAEVLCSKCGASLSNIRGDGKKLKAAA